MSTAPTTTTRLEIAQLAWPIILANAGVPLLGLVDTAVIGNFGSLAGLGAIAFGAVIFSFVYWSFGFLRMGTTGFVAQASGAENESEVRAALGRALLLALVLGLGLILLQSAILHLSLWLLDGSEEVEALTARYFSIRIWGAPAALALFALMGTLVGLGQTRTLLLLQGILNGLNIVLDIWFVAVLDYGVAGIAAGTALAEWISVTVGLMLVGRILLQRRKLRDPDAPFMPLPQLFDAGRMRRMLAANTDIMIRTLLLVLSFAWFVRLSAEFGTELLAGTHILLQLISFSAFFLDGFAHVAEALIGSAMGRGRRDAFDQAVRHTTELAAVSALVLATAVLAAGGAAIEHLTAYDGVRDAAITMLPMAAIYILLSFPAFQLDGIFIGATRTREMRNASIVSSLIFVLLSWPMSSSWGSQGLWSAFICFVCLRAVALWIYYPTLRGSIAGIRSGSAADTAG